MKSKMVVLVTVVVALNLSLLFHLYLLHQPRGGSSSYIHLYQINTNISDCAQKRLERVPDSPAPAQQPRTRFIIYTRYRSGSSFVGELFNSHPDVFYLFEPMNCIRKMLSAEAVSTNGSTYLQKLLNCDFQEINNVISLENNFLKSMVDTEVEECRVFRDVMEHFPDYQDTDIGTLEKLCNAFSHTGAKLIAMFSLSKLVDLIESGIKVLHLVRDPRSNWFSQMQILTKKFHLGLDIFLSFTENNLPYTLMKTTCEDTEKDLTFLRDLYFSTGVNESCSRLQSFQKNYRMVRYEDVARNTEQMTRRMYQFLEIPLDSKVTDWIKENTNADPKQFPREIRNSYSTKRNTTKVLQEWRHELPWKIVDVIQDQCSEPMKSLGYKSAMTEEELVDTEHTLLDGVEETWLAKFFLNNTFISE